MFSSRESWSADSNWIQELNVALFPVVYSFLFGRTLWSLLFLVCMRCQLVNTSPSRTTGFDSLERHRFACFESHQSVSWLVNRRAALESARLCGRSMMAFARPFAGNPVCVMTRGDEVDGSCSFESDE